MTTPAQKLLLLKRRDSAPSAWFECITTGAQTLTINSLGVASGESVTVDWGDGSSDTYTGTAMRTHAYASAGTWKVQFFTPENIRTFDVRDTKVRLHSTNIRSLRNVTTFTAIGLRNDGTFNSVDVKDWRPTQFYLSSMSAGFGGTFNSVDVKDWLPFNFYLFNMLTGYSVTFNSVDVKNWRPNIFSLSQMYTSFTFTFTPGDLAGWTTTTLINMNDNALSEAQVDQILADMYAAFATRTATGGTLNVGGSNAAPSGILQAACPPATGKECAYELANDSCGINPTRKWTTVTITA